MPCSYRRGVQSLQVISISGSMVILLVTLLGSIGHSNAAFGCSSPSFLVAPSLGGLSNPWLVAVDDFNQDGKPDLASVDGSRISIVLGNGDNTFRPSNTYTAGTHPDSIAAGDFNGDGLPDLAAASGNSDDIYVWLGNGDGTFRIAPSMKTAGQQDVKALYIYDFNNDGRMDLAVLSDFPKNAVIVHLGIGNGTFGPGNLIDITFQPLSLAVGDFNGDGKPDLAVMTNLVDTSLLVMLGNGDGSFQQSTKYNSGPAYSLAAGDFNRDGRVDIVVGSMYPRNGISVLLGNGDGSFQNPVSYAAGLHTYGVLVGDFNGDGNPDVAAANDGSGDVSLWLGQGDGSFKPARNFGAGRGVKFLVQGDFNKDGKMDLLAGPSLSLLAGNGDGTFRALVNYDVGRVPSSVAVADFNGDGRPDVAIANAATQTGTDGDISILLGNGDGSFLPAVHYPAGSQPRFISAADFNNDGRADLAVADVNTNKVWILLGIGDGTFQPAVSKDVAGYNPKALVIGDFNADGRPDLAVVGAAYVSVLLGNGDGGFQPLIFYAVGSVQSLTLGDFNGDGKIDLVAGSDFWDQRISVLFGNGDGTFQTPLVTASGMVPVFLVAGDFDQDGKMDLAMAGPNSGGLSIFRGNGNGTFQSPLRYATGYSPYSIVLSDFNGDGKPDLGVANLDVPTINPGSISLFLGNGNGTFQPAVNYVVGANPRSIAAGDFNGDGNIDLVTANQGSDSASILINTCSTPSCSNIIITAGPSSGNSVGAAFNQSLMATGGVSPYNFTLSFGSLPDGISLSPSGTLTGVPAAAGSFNVTITATDSRGCSKSISFVLGISKGNTSTVLATSSNPVLLGQTVTLTATIQVAPPSSGNPSGKVVFWDASVKLGEVAITEGPASLATSSLTAGDHRIEASYLGDDNFYASRSATLVQSVTAGSVDLSLANVALQNPVTAGSSLVYRIAVTNLTSSPATNVTVTSPLPTTTTFQSVAGSTQWSCFLPDIGRTGTVKCVRSAMAVPGSDELHLTVKVSCSAPNGSILTSIATLASNEFDSNPADNSSTSTVTVSNPTAIAPKAQSFPPAGGSGTIDVTVPDGCGWSVSSNASFITIDSGSSGTGNGTVSYSVAVNSDNSSRTGTITILGQIFTVSQSPSQRGSSQALLSIPAGGSNTTATVATSSIVQAGYATGTTSSAKNDGENSAEPSGDGPFGTAVFSVIENGVVVAEAGVPASPPTTSARIFIDYRDSTAGKSDRPEAGTIGINTGLALVNIGTTMASVTYRLRDGLGQDLAPPGHGTIPSRAHHALFIDQLKQIAPDFVLPSDFSTLKHFGSLEITSDQPLSIVALRLVGNQRGETLLTTTPVADLQTTPAAGPLYFPQLADGGGYQTSFVLLNTSSVSESGRIQILDNSGGPLAVYIADDPSGPASQFRYSIPPGGFYRLQTDGTPSGVKTGSVQVVPDAGNPAPVGAGVFSYASGGIRVTESGIPSATPTTHARIYVDLSGGYNTGIAIAAPDGRPLHVTFTAFQPDGVTPAGSGSLDLAGNGHGASFANELVGSLPNGFTGVLDISATSPFVALTMRSLNNVRQDFLLTTFPVADFNQLAPAPIVFPQIVDGGGYRTQFILLGTANPSMTILNFYADDGSPLAVGKAAAGAR